MSNKNRYHQTSCEVQQLPVFHEGHSVLHTPKGMSLMEVLASMFVICIGLLGVLAVIPYGAYQTAKARNAENASWLLDAAQRDLQTMSLALIDNWKLTPSTTPFDVKIPNNISSDTNGTGGTVISRNSSGGGRWLDCSRYFMVDPFDNAGTHDPSTHIYKVGVYFDNRSFLRERMTGQDDLVYTTHDDKRTDFSGQGNKVLSSGQYTWFFMFRPNVIGTPANINEVAWSDVDNTASVNVDILACYNRVPGTEVSVSVSNPVSYYSSSISVNIPLGDYDLKNTKYVFLSWDNNATRPIADGGWYKVIYATETKPDSTRDVFLKLSDGTPYTGAASEHNPQLLIIPGVMYHQRVPNVTIK